MIINYYAAVCVRSLCGFNLIVFWIFISRHHQQQQGNITQSNRKAHKLDFQVLLMMKIILNVHLSHHILMQIIEPFLRYFGEIELLQIFFILRLSSYLSFTTWVFLCQIIKIFILFHFVVRLR